ncbi:MAG: hypothetical protein MI747_00890 [Desulfobacterales bacterium]|nr:hypothetical protein [Desulfobacterales bacterium]
MVLLVLVVWIGLSIPLISRANDRVEGLPMSADCPDAVISSALDTSRSALGIRLEAAGDSCTISGRVGGEHISYIGVSGPGGTRYVLSFIPVQGKPGLFPAWPDGLEISPGEEKEISIPMDAPGFVLGISAHPYGEYRFTLTRQ